MPGLHFHEFDHDDVVRHPLVSAIISAYQPPRSNSDLIMPIEENRSARRKSSRERAKRRKELAKEEMLQDGGVEGLSDWAKWGNKWS